MDVKNENPQTILVRTIKNMDMQLARILIVDNDFVPIRVVCEKDFKLFIRNAALLNDGPLLRQLFRYNSIVGGEVLLTMLHKIEAATTLILAGAELNIQDITGTASPLHILLTGDHPRKLELAELMYDRGAICDFGYHRHSALKKCAIKAGASDDFLRKIVRNSGDNFQRCASIIAESEENQDLMLLLVTASPADEVTRRTRTRNHKTN